MLTADHSRSVVDNMNLRHLIVLPVLAVCAAMLPPMPKLVPRPDPVRSIRLSWEQQTNPVQVLVSTNLGSDAYWISLLQTTNDSLDLLLNKQPRFYKLFAARYSKLHIASPGNPFNIENVSWYFASPTGSVTPNGTYQAPYRYEQITNLFQAQGIDVALITGVYTNWTPSRIVTNSMEPPEIGADGYPAGYTVDVY